MPDSENDNDKDKDESGAEADSAAMRYGLIGQDAASDAEKLSKYTGQVDWQYLKPHYESGSLFFVDSRLALEDVGVAFSDDDKDRVAEWLGSGDLVKIEALHAAQWETEDEDDATRFAALVVSPFVLCRPIVDLASPTQEEAS